MSSEYNYLTPVRMVRSRLTRRNSRFISTLVPIEDELAARDIIAAVKAEFSDATHHAYAYRVGIASNLLERFDDAHEPAGTAGAPMLHLLQGKKISDAILIGTRYFGGTKLGIGGLVRAYRDCALQSIEAAKLIEKEPTRMYMLAMAYEDQGAVSRLIESLQGVIKSSEFAESVSLEVQIPYSVETKFMEGFQSVSRGRGRIKKI